MLVSTILVLSIATHLLVERTHSEIEGYADTINIAGRQRMLSQRITLLSVKYTQKRDASDLTDLNDAIDLMRHQHLLLTVPPVDSHYSRQLTPALQELYEGEGLAQEVDGFLIAAGRIAAGDTPSEDGVLNLILALSAGPMLEKLDQAVSLYQRESEQTVKQIRQIQFGTTAILVLSILIEALLIFRPLIQYSSQMHRLAMLDDLTGISNRRSFIAACNQHITDPNEHAHRTAFLLMDIDNFKSVNDRYGHDAGDIVLIEVAQLLQNKARQRDMVGRLGGEEFGVMLTNINPSQAVYASERILKSIAATQIRITPDTHISITMSGGLTMLKAEEPLSDSIKRADRLLYQAKNAGKACIQYDNASST